jgi:hypothetical protein
VLVEIQFPICDVRGFVPDPDLRRVLPDWPNPSTDIRPQFVHYFGRAVERRRQPDQAWPDEIKFCQAARAFRFDQLEHSIAAPNGERIRFNCAFRRLFCDGRSLVRVEVGLTENRRRNPLNGLRASQLVSYAAATLDLSTVVPRVGAAPVTDRLLRQGDALARLYAQATLKNRSPEKRAAAELLVEAGNPVMLIEIGKRQADLAIAPCGFTQIEPEAVLGARVFFGRIKTASGMVATWILQGATRNAPEMRGLRLCLMRLHAEQEALDLVLKQIQRRRLLNPPRRETVDQLDDYFKRSTRIVNRSAWGKISQSAILEAFDAAEEVAPPANRQNLVDRYEGARNQIWKTIDRYQTRRASSRLVNVLKIERGASYVEKQQVVNQSGHGNFLIVSEYMKDVSISVANNVKTSQTGDDVKSLVATLSDQIKAISEEIDQDQALKMGKNLKKLGDEMAEPKPDREWYQLSLKGIKEAAEAVGAIAAPVLKTVAALSPLLLGS